jgi:hypothetical protein
MLNAGKEMRRQGSKMQGQSKEEESSHISKLAQNFFVFVQACIRKFPKKSLGLLTPPESGSDDWYDQA